MRRAFAVAVLILAAASTHAAAETKLPPLIHVLGEVTTAARPVEDALVIAFGLSNFEATQVFTSTEGAFRLPPLKSGVYRVIAVKQGFAPAIATVIPTVASTRLAFRLKQGKANPETASQIWEIRRALPSDVLRELDNAMLTPDTTSERVEPRFAGEMTSMTGVAAEAGPGGFAQTNVHLRGNLADGWKVNVSGQMQQQSASRPLDDPIASSSGIVMDLQTSSSQTVRVASMKNSWKLHPDRFDGGDADLQAHRIEWNHHASGVELKYTSHENLFAAREFGSEVIELAGRTQLYGSENAGVDVALRVRQESIPTVGTMTTALRNADLLATGRWSVADRVALTYGVNTRLSEYGNAYSPESGIEVRIGKQSAIVASGMYKVGEPPTPFAYVPLVITLDDTTSVLPRYRYSIGFVSGETTQARFSATFNVSAIDAPVSLLFDDSMGNNFWDGYVLDSGDIHRALTVGYSRSFGRNFAMNVSSTAAQTETEETNEREKHFVLSNVRTHFRPSGTSIELAYRLVKQPEDNFALFNASGERMNVRVGQSLRLPLDLTLLLGMDLAKTTGSLVVADGPQEEDDYQKRYVGGLSLAF